MSKPYKQIISLMMAGAFIGTASIAMASGFSLLEESTSQIRTAVAGSAAIAEDASTGYYNSAGLTHLGNEQIAVSLVGIIPHSTLRASHATPTVTRIGPRQIPGSVQNIAPGRPGHNRSVSVIPALHYAYRINDCWVFGFNVTEPFGLKTKYKNHSVARYMSTRAEIRTYDLSPSLAYDFGNGLSVGAGIDFLHTMVKLDSRVGIGHVHTDGSFENTLSRWAAAGHVGLLYDFNDCTRLGIQYRSGFNTKARGDSKFFFRAIPQRRLAFKQGVRTTLRMPGSVVVSGYHDITDCWAIMADYQYTNWSRFNNIVAKFEDCTRLVQKFNFKDTSRYALGTSYRFDECLLGSLGVAYDKSPVRKRFRTTIIPDSDRTWAALGLKYYFHECLSLDLAYAHLFFKNSRIHQTAPRWNGILSPQQSIKGRYKSRADLVGVQLTWDIA